MYIIKNALTSIKRNKGRNILIGIIILVISATSSITLAIRSSANNIVKSYEEQYNLEASISMDRQALMESFKNESSSQEEMIEQFNNIEELTIEQINNYGNSDYLKSYYYIYNTSVNVKDIEETTDSLIKETTKTETTTKSWGSDYQNGGFPGGRVPSGGQTTTKQTTITEKIFNDKVSSGAFTLIGYSSYESMSEFINGTYSMTSGSIFNDLSSAECIISEELAVLNELEVGDEITLLNPNDEDLTYKVKISGIYKENSDDANDMSSMFSRSANQIITTSSVIEKIIADDEDLSVTITPTFILKDEDSIDKFKSEVEEKGLSEYYIVTTNEEMVKNATKSISNVKSFAMVFLVITLIIGGVVLFVINMINIRERKYEIGVLRTIGMKKSLVISQFMLELLIVAIFSLLIGAGVGSLCSVNIANSLLENEINNSSEQIDNINKNFGGMNTYEGSNKKIFVGNNKISGVVNIEQVSNINAVVDFKVLIELLAIGILLTIFSSISSGVAISRFSPLDILKER